MKTKWLVAAATAAGLAGCTVQDANDTAADPAANTAATPEVEQQGVTRQEVLPEPEPTPPPAPAAIQTQPGPNGSSVTLNRVAVVGDVLTVALTVTGASCCTYPELDQISLIDDKTAQRISILKDNAGNWMASPLDTGKKRLRIGSDPTSQIWFKFPAPPADSPTVSLTIPEVAPFDAIPVTR